AGDERRHELAAEVRGRRLAPGNERSYPREGEEQESEWDVYPIEERCAHGDLGPPHRLGKYGKERPPQHRERNTHEQEVVEQERRLAAQHGLELNLRLELGPARVEQRERQDRSHDEEAEEEVADIGLGEAVHAGDDARPGDERAEDAEQEGPDDEAEVPALEHAALLLDHHRMEERGHREPR